MPVDSTSAGQARASKRLARTAAVTATAATDVFTSTAAFLNDLFTGDVVSFSGLTGGAGILTTIEYYIVKPITSTTFKVSATAGGSPLDVTTDLTAGTISTGKLQAGPLSGNHITMGSVAGGGPDQS